MDNTYTPPQKNENYINWSAFGLKIKRINEKFIRMLRTGRDR